MVRQKASKQSVGVLTGRISKRSRRRSRTSIGRGRDAQRDFRLNDNEALMALSGANSDKSETAENTEPISCKPNKDISFSSADVVNINVVNEDSESTEFYEDINTTLVNNATDALESNGDEEIENGGLEHLFFPVRR